ncbi:hypothetical protein FD04_GL001111 [Secundilactobacillus odoratitofui DSM 19909 = JCM 15043]|uniref:Uncharacterized protein n=1 Tax=Secundilactobacillus odoratitofui DSM 19909 = JCM 15043 TaxID=1423776 RepID=A0A0R1LQJ4_9LACO|nr:hypothetical protein FD04_GL001111 [Secundilactobacillus odoratitofui DSM 19909 = JCM 15043]
MALETSVSHFLKRREKQLKDAKKITPCVRLTSTALQLFERINKLNLLTSS